jgi:CheY-like chemotaxis protein
MLRDDDAPVLQALSRLIGKGDVVSYVGPALSAFAGAPTSSDLAQSLQQDLHPSSPAAPLGAVAQTFRDQFGSHALLAHVRAAIESSAPKATQAHHLVCELPFLVHVTTNLDTVLEDKLRALKYPVNLVAEPHALDRWNESREVQVMKLHGDLTRPDTFSLADREVAYHLGRGSLIREKLLALLRYRTSLFIGYNFNDPDLALILADRLHGGGPTDARPGFAITFDTHPSILEEWRKKSIHPIAVDLAGATPEVAMTEALEVLTAMTPTHSHGCEVLIVDDEPSLRISLKMMVERWAKLPAESTEDGIGALLRMPALRPRLLIVDLIMPRMDGWTLIEMVKKEPAFEFVRFIVLTGMENPDWMRRAEAMGIPYIMKPFDTKDFLAAIERQMAPRER